MGVAGMADSATASDGRHTHGGPAAKDRKRSVHRYRALAFGSLACGGRLIVFVTSTYAIRSSYRQFCRKLFSAGVRFPMVLAAMIESVSIVWRAPIRSTVGLAFCSRMRPS